MTVEKENTLRLLIKTYIVLVFILSIYLIISKTTPLEFNNEWIARVDIPILFLISTMLFSEYAKIKTNYDSYLLIYFIALFLITLFNVQELGFKLANLDVIIGAYSTLQVYIATAFVIFRNYYSSKGNYKKASLMEKYSKRYLEMSYYYLSVSIVLTFLLSW